MQFESFINCLMLVLDSMTEFCLHMESILFNKSNQKLILAANGHLKAIGIFRTWSLAGLKKMKRISIHFLAKATKESDKIQNILIRKRRDETIERGRV